MSMEDNKVLRRCLHCKRPVSEATISLRVQGDSGEGWICDIKDCHLHIGELCTQWGLVEQAGVILIEDAPPNLLEFQIPFRNTQRDYSSLPNKIAAVIRRYKKYERGQQAKSEGRRNGSGRRK